MSVGEARLGAGGSALSVRIAGYQFAEADNDWDANWLTVAVDVRTPQRAWQALAPALLTWEARELAAWLDAVAEATDGGRGFSGLEGTVQLEAADMDGRPVLTVVFWRDLAPAGSGEDEVHVTFSLTAEDVRRFAGELRAAVEPFPVRVVEQDGYASKLLAGEL